MLNTNEILVLTASIIVCGLMRKAMRVISLQDLSQVLSIYVVDTNISQMPILSASSQSPSYHVSAMQISGTSDVIDKVEKEKPSIRFSEDDYLLFTNGSSKWIKTIPAMGLKQMKGDLAVIKEMTKRFIRFSGTSNEPVLQNAPRKKSHYQLVLMTSSEIPPDAMVAPRDITNTLILLSLYQKVYSFAGVVFSVSTPILKLCKRLELFCYFGYKHNPFYLPYFNNLYSTIRREFDSDYYGYVNGDILLDDSIFAVLEDVTKRVKEGKVTRVNEVSGNVRDRFFDPFIDICRNQTGFTLETVRSSISQNRKGSLRHRCSGDYFIFSRDTPESLFSEYVIGRYSIDNYLLSRMEYANGTLLDTTFIINAFHQGSTTTINKMRNGVVLEGDIDYNMNKMAKEGVLKGCLIRNAKYLLCIANGEVTTVDYYEGIQYTHWNPDEKTAIKEWNAYKKNRDLTLRCT